VNLVHSHSIDIPLEFITEIVTTGLPPRSAEPKKIRLTKMTPLDMMEILNLADSSMSNIKNTSAAAVK